MDLQELGKEIRVSLRGLRRAPGFTLLSTLCLTLGVGSSVAIFTVTDAFLLRPLPFAEPDRLYNIWMTVAGGRDDARYFVDPANFTELQRQSLTMDIAGVQEDQFNIGTDTLEPQRVAGAYSTANLLDVLGVQPLVGRFFVDEEETREAAVCMLSEGFWRSRLGASLGLVGTAIHLNGAPFVVTGIVPAGVGFPDRVDVWVPITRAVREGRLGITVLGRLRKESTRAEAEAEVEAVAERLRELDPLSNRDSGLGLDRLAATLDDEVGPALWSLVAAVGFLLAIACANVASLVLVRHHRRAPELALASALGATPQVVARKLLIEGGLLAAAGTAGGVAVAWLAAPALLALSPGQLPGFQTLAVDLRALGFALLISIVTVLAFATIPALLAARQPPALVLRSGGRGSTLGIRRFQRILVVVDVTLAMVLLAGAGLMVRNFSKLQDVDPGYDVDGLVTFKLTSSARWAETHTTRVQFLQSVEASVATIPGIESTAATHNFPLTGVQYWVSFVLEDRPLVGDEQAEMGQFQLVTPGYLEQLRIPLLNGRMLAATDRTGALPVVIVSRSLVQRYWPDQDPLGKRLRPARDGADAPWWTIVGVVGDQRDRGLGEAVGPSMYFSQHQFERAYTRQMTIVARLSRPIQNLASVLRGKIREVDPNAIVFEVTTTSQILGDSLRKERFLSLLSAILASLALVLAGAGIFGVLSYSIEQRRGELGVRVAFGASSRNLQHLLVKQTMLPVLTGVVLGTVVVAGLSPLLEKLLQVSATEPLALVVAAATLSAVALLASYLPARRVSRLPVWESLRSQ